MVTEAEHNLPKSKEQMPSTLHMLPRKTNERVNCQLNSGNTQRGHCSTTDQNCKIKSQSCRVPCDSPAHSSTSEPKASSTTSRKRCCPAVSAQIDDPKRCVRKRIKTVRFHPCVKTWDGKCSANQYLQRLAKDFFNGGQRLDLLRELLQRGKLEDLCALETSVADLIQRVQVRRNGITPILKRTGSFALTHVHMPGLQYLLKCTKLIRDVCKRNQNRKSLFAPKHDLGVQIS